VTAPQPEAPAAQLKTELANSREASRMLAKVIVGHSRAMEAARIELAQGSAEKAMQWILNSLPDVWDDDETAWDGCESADEWWDRTDPFYRAAEKPAAGSAPDDTGQALPIALADARARAEAAEAKVLVLESAVTWGTSCLSCARILDSAYAETVRREKAEAKLAEIDQTIATFLAVRGLATAFEDLAEALRQVTGREDARHA
jgi:hypothetical protein